MGQVLQAHFIFFFVLLFYSMRQKRKIKKSHCRKSVIRKKKLKHPFNLRIQENFKLLTLFFLDIFRYDFVAVLFFCFVCI